MGPQAEASLVIVGKRRLSTAVRGTAAKVRANLHEYVEANFNEEDDAKLEALLKELCEDADKDMSKMIDGHHCQLSFEGPDLFYFAFIYVYL